MATVCPADIGTSAQKALDQIFHPLAHRYQQRCHTLRGRFAIQIGLRLNQIPCHLILSVLDRGQQRRNAVPGCVLVDTRHSKKRPDTVAPAMSGGNIQRCGPHAGPVHCTVVPRQQLFHNRPKALPGGNKQCGHPGIGLFRNRRLVRRRRHSPHIRAETDGLRTRATKPAVDIHCGGFEQSLNTQRQPLACRHKKRRRTRLTLRQIDVSSCLHQGPDHSRMSTQSRHKDGRCFR